MSEPKTVQVRIELMLGGHAGAIDLELYPEKVPVTVANFLSHIERGTYKASTFHRVINGFMIQGGQPADGERDFESIVGEFGKLSHDRGVISMARSKDPNSATCEFFIMHKAAPHLDQAGYAAFGTVLEGLEWVDKIAESPVQANGGMGGESSEPAEPIGIVDITVIEAA